MFLDDPTDKLQLVIDFKKAKGLDISGEDVEELSDEHCELTYEDLQEIQEVQQATDEGVVSIKWDETDENECSSEIKDFFCM